MRWIVWIVAAIAAAGLLVVVIGATLPQAHRASRTVRVPMAAEALYAMLSDVSQYPTWRTDVKSLQRLPDRDGHPAWIEEAGGMKIPLHFEQMVAPSLLVARIDGDLPFGGTWTYRVEPAGPGASTLTITEDGEVYNVFFRFMSRFVFGYHATMDAFIKHLQARAAVR